MPVQMRRDFYEKLAAIEDTLLTMGDDVLEMASEAMAALADRDIPRAEAVIRADDRVDAKSNEVEQEIFTLLALQSPVAGELRLLQAFVHTNVHLERMGDQCVNIAKFVALTESMHDDPELSDQLQEMGGHARRVVSQTLAALRGRDVALARQLPEFDEPVDRLNKGLFKRLAQIAASDETKLDWAMRMVLVSRYLERLADHAVDVGEQVIFAETGERPELSSNSPE